MNYSYIYHKATEIRQLSYPFHKTRRLPRLLKRSSSQSSARAEPSSPPPAEFVVEAAADVTMGDVQTYKGRHT